MIAAPLASGNNNRCILSFTDAFSKYAELVAIPDQTPETVARTIFAKWIFKNGVPNKIITNREKEFCNELTAELFRKMKMTSDAEIKFPTFYYQLQIKQLTYIWSKLSNLPQQTGKYILLHLGAQTLFENIPSDKLSKFQEALFITDPTAKILHNICRQQQETFQYFDWIKRAPILGVLGTLTKFSNPFNRPALTLALDRSECFTNYFSFNLSPGSSKDDFTSKFNSKTCQP